jgi:hypothetical protein
MSERDLINDFLIESSNAGLRMFRNNAGLARFKDEKTGQRRVVKYGVANPGGSDCLGWHSVVITPEMVGRKVAVFVAAEIKTEGVSLTKEQRAFLAVVKEAGGIALEVRSVAGFFQKLWEWWK